MIFSPPPHWLWSWAILLGTLLSLTVGCEHWTPTNGGAAVDTSRGLHPTQVSWDATFTMNEDGRRRAHLVADRVEQYETSDSTFSVWRSPEDTARVRAYLFDQQGDSSATVTADSLVFQEQKGRLDAFGDVVVVTETNKRLETEHLIWNQADRKIRSRRFVHITTPKEVVQGTGLVADESLETYQIGQFTAEVEVDEEDAPSGSGEN